MNTSFTTRLRALVLVAVVLFSLGAGAQARAATASGASTPRATVITYVLATRSGNIVKLCSIANPKYLNGLPASWGKTCVAKFKHYIAAYPKLWALTRLEARNTPLSKLKSAKVKIKGNAATVTWTETKTTKTTKATSKTIYYLTRISGKWLFDYSDISETGTVTS